MAAPCSTHFSAILRILWYLKGTLFHRLYFSSQSLLQLHAYIDADWAGDSIDRRSTTGYYFLLGTSLISWRSKKQTIVARSSTEAKYCALVETTDGASLVAMAVTRYGCLFFFCYSYILCCS
jgi:hypothetical protein